jgi:hypothetical protein
MARSQSGASGKEMTKTASFFSFFSLSPLFLIFSLFLILSFSHFSLHVSKRYFESANGRYPLKTFRLHANDQVELPSDASINESREDGRRRLLRLSVFGRVLDLSVVSKEAQQRWLTVIQEAIANSPEYASMEKIA